MRREILLVFALSLGASAVYAIVALGAKLTSGQPLGSSSTSINNSKAPPTRPTLDLIYQLLSIGFALVPVLLAWHFIGVAGERASVVLGIDAGQPGRDLARGAVLAALVGGTGLGAYVIARHLGMNVSVVASGLPAVWWRLPVLILFAFENAVLEEVLLAYLLSRLERLGWKPWPAVAVSAVLRGSYHLYQGFGAFLGNAAMGVLFGRLYQRWGRTMPMIIAHGLIDSVAFVGYVLLADKLPWLH